MVTVVLRAVTRHSTRDRRKAPDVIPEDSCYLGWQSLRQLAALVGERRSGLNALVRVSTRCGAPPRFGAMIDRRTLISGAAGVPCWLPRLSCSTRRRAAGGTGIRRRSLAPARGTVPRGGGVIRAGAIAGNGKDDRRDAQARRLDQRLGAARARTRPSVHVLASRPCRATARRRWPPNRQKASMLSRVGGDGRPHSTSAQRARLRADVTIRSAARITATVAGCWPRNARVPVLVSAPAICQRGTRSSRSSPSGMR